MKIAMWLGVIGTSALRTARGASQPPSGPPLKKLLCLIAPVGQRAEIDARTTLAALTARVGAANLRPERIYLGEGEYRDGTLLFHSDPLRRLEIIWNAGANGGPSLVRPVGPKTVWAVAPG